MPILETLAIAASVAAIVSGFKDSLSLFKKWKARKKKVPDQVAEQPEPPEQGRLLRHLEKHPSRINSEYMKGHQSLGSKFARGDDIAKISLMRTLLHLDRTLVETLKQAVASSKELNLLSLSRASETTGTSVANILRDLWQRLQESAPIRRPSLSKQNCTDHDSEGLLPARTPLHSVYCYNGADTLLRSLRDEIRSREGETYTVAAQPSRVRVNKLEGDLASFGTTLSGAALSQKGGKTFPAGSASVLAGNLQALGSATYSTPSSSHHSSISPSSRRSGTVLQSNLEVLQRASSVSNMGNSSRNTPSTIIWNEDQSPRIRAWATEARKIARVPSEVSIASSHRSLTGHSHPSAPRCCVV